MADARQPGGWNGAARIISKATAEKVRKQEVVELEI
jgi:hypothetical protein